MPLGGGAGQHVQIHAAAQHAAVLVVGVVAADLRAAGAAEQGGVTGIAKLSDKLLCYMDSPAAGGLQSRLAPI